MCPISLPRPTPVALAGSPAATWPNPIGSPVSREREGGEPAAMREMVPRKASQGENVRSAGAWLKSRWVQQSRSAMGKLSLYTGRVVYATVHWG